MRWRFAFAFTLSFDFARLGSGGWVRVHLSHEAIESPLTFLFGFC
jgi:hypothetical protein